MTAVRRRRQPFWQSGWFQGFVWVAVIGLCLLFLNEANLGKTVLYWVAGGLVGMYCLGAPLDEWWVRRRFRASPYHNDDIEFTLSADGAHAKGRDSELTLGWSAFTAARICKDGLLLFQGPNVCNWLPNTAA